MQVRLIKSCQLRFCEKRAKALATSTVTLGTFAVRLESVNIGPSDLAGNSVWFGQYPSRGQARFAAPDRKSVFQPHASE